MDKMTAADNREILEAALQGLEGQREKIAGHIAQVQSLLGRRRGRPPKSISDWTANGNGHPRRVLSEDARRRISAAQKKRWAAARRSQEQ
jgi:hypothetical protein